MAMALHPSRRWLRLSLYAALTLTTFSAVSSALSPCHSHSGDALLDRVDTHLARCLPAQTAALDGFKDALNANELEAQAPLALVAFSSSSAQLTRLAVAVATATADVSPAVRVIDFSELLSGKGSSPPPPDNHELRQTLRSQIAATLNACPQQRTLFVVRGLEAVTGDRLPLLDVFLDPMNGERALLHDQTTGRDLDCRRALFVFLYRQRIGESELTKSTWKDFLVAKWNDHTQTEKFTPQALAGRLTVAVQLTAENELAGDAERTLSCDWDGYLTRLGVARRREEEEAAAQAEQPTAQETTGVAPLGESPWSTLQPAVVFGLLLLFIALFVAAKRFVVSSKEMEEVVLIQQARRESTGRATAAHDEESTTTYALRNRTVVAASHTELQELQEPPETPSKAASKPKTKPAATPPKPQKPTPGKRPASARAASQREPQATGIVAPPPTPANASDAQSPRATRSSKRRARRATHSGAQ